MGIARDLRRARSLGPQAWRDFTSAALELAIARIRLAARPAGHLLGEQAAGASPGEHARTLIDRVAFAIPRVASRVPWRSTCLVQALAAQRWLERHGIASKVVLGARDQGGTLDAHAWLEADGRVVVGGEVAGYSRFGGPADS